MGGNISIRPVKCGSCQSDEVFMHPQDDFGIHQCICQGCGNRWGH